MFQTRRACDVGSTCAYASRPRVRGTSARAVESRASIPGAFEVREIMRRASRNRDCRGIVTRAPSPIGDAPYTPQQAISPMTITRRELLRRAGALGALSVTSSIPLVSCSGDDGGSGTDGGTESTGETTDGQGDGLPTYEYDGEPGPERVQRGHQRCGGQVVVLVEPPQLRPR